MTNRVNENYLDFDGDQSILDGKPFTGIGFLEHPDHSLKREFNYLDGFEHGLCQEWYSNGQLKRKWTAVRGQAKGTVYQWHENGEKKSVGEYDFGVETAYKEWDEKGELIIDRKIDENSNLYSYLMDMKEKRG